MKFLLILIVDCLIIDLKEGIDAISSASGWGKVQ